MPIISVPRGNQQPAIFHDTSGRSIAAKLLRLPARLYRLGLCDVKAAASRLLVIGAKTKCYGDMRARNVQVKYTFRGAIGL